jgi:hypothetical protein
MPFSSKAKKVKSKGTVRELKLVQSVTRRGADTIIAEEVKTPPHCLLTTPSTSQRNQSSSPFKRSKLWDFDADPIPFDLEGSNMPKTRLTLVFLFFHHCHLQRLTIKRDRTTS